MKLEIPKGMSLYNAVAYAKQEASANTTGEVELEFNGISLRVHKYSLDYDIETIYYLKRRLDAYERT